jgi:hypothetical protein
MGCVPAPHLAQVNVARPRAPLSDALMAEFTAALAPVNALADAAPGFVWRLQDATGDATAVPVPGDPGLIVNLSVWRSPGALRAFVYSGEHLAYMRRRHAWFARMAEAWQAMWWVPAGHEPPVEEAESRLLLVRAWGSTPAAFTWAQPYDPEGRPVATDGPVPPRRRSPAAVRTGGR